MSSIFKLSSFQSFYFGRLGTELTACVYLANTKIAKGIYKKYFISILFMSLAKGQLISKANCQAEDSSKKRMNEFVFTTKGLSG